MNQDQPKPPTNLESMPELEPPVEGRLLNSHERRRQLYLMKKRVADYKQKVRDRIEHLEKRLEKELRS